MGKFTSEKRFFSKTSTLSIDHLQRKARSSSTSTAGKEPIIPTEKPITTSDVREGLNSLGLKLSDSQIERLKCMSGKCTLESLLEMSKQVNSRSENKMVKQESNRINPPNTSAGRPYGHALKVSERAFKANVKNMKNDSSGLQILLNSVKTDIETARECTRKHSIKKINDNRKENIIAPLGVEEKQKQQRITEPKLIHDIHKRLLDSYGKDLNTVELKLMETIQKENKKPIESLRQALSDLGIQLSKSDFQTLFPKDMIEKKRNEYNLGQLFLNSLKTKSEKLLPDKTKLALGQFEKVRQSTLRNVAAKLKENYGGARHAYRELQCEGKVTSETITSRLFPKAGVQLGKEDSLLVLNALGCGKNEIVNYEDFARTIFGEGADSSKSSSHCLSHQRQKLRRRRSQMQKTNSDSNKTKEAFEILEIVRDAVRRNRKTYKNAFLDLDHDKDGKISAEELRLGLENWGLKLQTAELNKLIQTMRNLSTTQSSGKQDNARKCESIDYLTFSNAIARDYHISDTQDADSEAEAKVRDPTMKQQNPCAGTPEMKSFRIFQKYVDNVTSKQRSMTKAYLDIQRNINNSDSKMTSQHILESLNEKTGEHMDITQFTRILSKAGVSSEVVTLNDFQKLISPKNAHPVQSLSSRDYEFQRRINIEPKQCPKSQSPIIHHDTVIKLLQPEIDVSAVTNLDYMTSTMGEGQRRKKCSVNSFSDTISSLIKGDIHIHGDYQCLRKRIPTEVNSAKFANGNRLSELLHHSEILSSEVCGANEIKTTPMKMSMTPPPAGRASCEEKSTSRRKNFNHGNQSCIFENLAYPNERTTPMARRKGRSEINYFASNISFGVQ